MEATLETSKVLEKGPEYLRKQMELEGETKGRVSAVERLAATKPKYVKSQQVVNSIQEPAITLGSGSVSSTGSSNRSSNRGKTGTIGGFRGGTSPAQVRRSTSKKRPDSLLLHRQKCELLRGSRLTRKHHVVRRRFVNDTVSKKVPLLKLSDAEGDSEGQSPPATPEKATAAAQLLRVPEFERRAGRGVGRSHSDISSRYSKNFADFDAFFKFCGLDRQVVDALGRDNFSAHSDKMVGDDVIAGKEEGEEEEGEEGEEDKVSRSSGDSDGLLEVELRGSIRQGTSVIERNARIIKWLYSCKNAKETGKKLRDLD